MESGDYIASASSLTHIPRLLAGQLGGYIFTREKDGATDIGLMSRDLRERNALEGMVQVDGRVEQVKCIGDAVWVMTSDRMVCYRIAVDRLRRLFAMDRRGVMDFVALDRNRLAVVGSRGRAVLRPLPEVRGQQTGTILEESRVPSGFEDAQSDGRFVMVRNDRGCWQYDMRRGFSEHPSPSDWNSDSRIHMASTIHAALQLDVESSQCVLERRDSEAMIIEFPNRRLETVASIDGRFWVGHSHGISVIDPRSGSVVDDLHLDGPVFLIYPTLDGRGALWASEHDGVGVARWVN